MATIQGIPSARSATIPLALDTGAAIVTPYVWDNLQSKFVPQNTLPALDPDGGQLTHITNWSGFTGGGGGASDVTIHDPTTPANKLAIDSSGRVTVLISGTVPVSGTVGISGTVPVSGPLTDTQLRASAVPVSGTFWQTTQPVSIAAALDVGDRAARLLGHVTVDNASLAVTGTFWQATQPVSGTFWQATQPVSIAATVATKEVKAGTPTQSSVAASATSVTLLAANANRLGATIYNDDTASVLSLKLGATASATSFTLKIAAGGYYEVPFGYTGQIDGIWNVASGSARITELAA